MYGVKDAEWFCGCNNIAYLQKTHAEIKFKEEVYTFEGSGALSGLNKECVVSHSPIDTSRPARYSKLQKSSGVFRYIEDKNTGLINILSQPNSLFSNQKYIQKYQSCLITRQLIKIFCYVLTWEENGTSRVHLEGIKIFVPKFDISKITEFRFRTLYDSNNNISGTRVQI